MLLSQEPDKEFCHVKVKYGAKINLVDLQTN